MAAFIVFAAINPATVAARQPISGKLNGRGYTVLAVAANGKATSVQTSSRRFKIRPPARRVTLHLRGPDGVYAGPIVVASEKRGTRAIVGVKAGVRLGRVKIDARRGYAKLRRRLARRWIDGKRWARASKGAPIGVRNFGLVRSRHARGPTVDPDLDGVPNPLDVDDNGNLILDNLEQPASRSAKAQAAQAEDSLGLTPVLPLSIQSTANANATGLTVQQSDTALVQNGQLQIGSRLAGELDCGGQPDPNNPNGWIGGLRYCTRGGIGTVFGGGTPGGLGGGPRFPECCDPDHDGLGDLAAGGLALHEGATSDQIRSGDLLIERVTAGGVEAAYPATLQYVFATVPALASYSDTGGTEATVHYPVTPPHPPGLTGGGPGTTGNGFPVKADPVTGNVVVTFTFWRPQRRHTEGDPGQGEWMDIGRLTYLLAWNAARPFFCPQSSYSTPAPNLPPANVPGPDMSGQPGGGFTDLTPDQPADPANTLSFAVNLTQCLASRGRAFNPGDELGIQLSARASNTRPDTAFQAFEITRQP